MTITEHYREFRQHSPFMLVGENAKLSLEAARTYETWLELEANELVKIEAHPDYDPDPSFYDNWPHLSERSKQELKDRYCADCWVVAVYVRCRSCNQWRCVDSIGGNSGYDDPCSPFENCYVIDMMQTAIDNI